MAKEKNKPIGECECSHKGCDLTAQVFKFRERKPDVAWLRRFGGKLYAKCERGHKCDDQEYLLEKDRVKWVNEKAKAAPVQKPVEVPAAPVVKPEEKAVAPVVSANKKTMDKDSAPVPAMTRKGGAWGWW